MSELDRASLDRILPPSFGSADWDDVLRRAGPRRERRGRRLVGVVAGLLVLVVGTASAFGTVRDLFGDGKPHVQRGFYPSEGKRGSFTVRILFMRDAGGDQTRSWRIVPEQGVHELSVPATGQYAQVTGRGRIVRIGGHAQAWSARLEGFVTRPGAAKQRVVITMKGRPKGVFVLTPLQPGVLKRDSGTQRHTATTG
jgi:hypothetical protein